MLRVLRYLAPARLSPRRAALLTRVLWPTLTHRLPAASSALAAETAAAVMVGRTPKRGASRRNRVASSGSQP